MSFQIILTANFLREFKPLEKKYKSIVKDLIALPDSLLASPVQGIPLGKDCFKIRMAIKSKGKGRSGGARVITCIKLYIKNIPAWHF
jgi:mRNA-degrading endonuclease RelE of RelBE toxin-antitoxin system